MEVSASGSKTYSFLQGGGEMGELTGRFDWSTTGIGTPDRWPQSLRTTVGNLLRSRFPMFLWWGDDLIQFYNDAYRPSLGTEGKHPKALGEKGQACWPEIWETIFPLIQQVKAGGEPTWMTDQLIPIRRNGKLEDVYWTFSYSLVLDDDDSPAGVLVTCMETTETVNGHRKIAESEHHVRGIVESAPFPIGVFTGPDMRIQLTNQSIRDIWGKGPDLAGRLVADVLPEFQPQGILARLDQVYTTGLPVHIKNQRVDLVVHGKLQPGYFNYSFTPLFDNSGRVYGVMNTGADVTDVNLAKQKVDESEKNLRNTILQAPFAICIFRGADFIIEIANASMFRFWGKSSGEVMNKPLFEAIPEAKDQGYEKLLTTVLESGEPFSASELPVTLPRDGVVQTVFINFAYQPLKGGDGTISGIMAIATDVTEQVLARHKVEELVAQRTGELAEANEALLISNKELRRSNQSLEEFVHAASHDLQEPIRKILFFTHHLKHQFSPQLKETELSYFNRIEKASQRMGGLIDDLLLYSHVSQRPLETEVIDLNERVQRVLEDLELNIQQKAAVIHVGKLPVVKGYGTQLQQLFQNLISNALKYSKEDVPHSIAITAGSSKHDEQAHHVIAVEDNGIGFEQQYADKIFQMFSRLHGRAEYSGTGVGLSIVKKVVENHNGFIRVESTPDQGATFKVFLPA